MSDESVSKTKLFIGNLPFSAGEDQLREIFSQFGELSSVSLITDRQTGRSRGFAFAEFVELSAAQAAAEQNGILEMDGRKLIIREAQDRKERPSFGGDRGGFRPRRDFHNDRRDRYDRDR